MSDYTRLSGKIFRKALLLSAVIWGALYLVYRLLLSGRFAEFLVRFISLFTGDDQKAWNLYMTVFRMYGESYLILAVFILFALLLRICLKDFQKYFSEIDRGIDSLSGSIPDDIHLSDDLRMTEAKINSVRHILNERQETAREAEQKKNELVVYLAHDLKTPLTSVIGYLNLLLQRPDLSASTRAQYTGIALEKAQRLETLIGELFEITQLNLTTMKLSVSRIDLSFMMRQTLSEFQPILKEKNMSFSSGIQSGIQMDADPDRLERVLNNVIRNAVNYGFPGTEIQTDLRKEGNCVRIIISNHGNTLSSEETSQLFEPFYRADAARGGESGGAGLGLAVSKKIVELHHGTITAESKDQTIRIIIRLPLTYTTEEPSSGARSS